MAKEAISILTEKEFPKFIADKASSLVIVDFYADWCGACMQFAPTFHAIAEKYLDKKVKFAKINVDSANTLANKYEISSIPRTIFFKNGKQVYSIKGSVSEEEFEEEIKAYL